MAFKVFEKLSLKTLFLQIAYAFFLLGWVFILDLNKISFFAGLFFSYLYMGLFFFSLHLIFIQKRKILGLLILFSKWFFLLFALILVAWFLEGKAFLLGLSSFIVALLAYILEQFKNNK